MMSQRTRRSSSLSQLDDRFNRGVGKASTDAEASIDRSTRRGSHGLLPFAGHRNATARAPPRRLLLAEVRALTAVIL
jgi:hypothetical protein